MDPRMLQYYTRELQHIREMCGEFAREYPKIAGRLGLEGLECADPYVERLLEGFGYMAARVQLKVDAEYPRFSQHLLEMVYPHFLAPQPSMAMVQVQPDLNEGSLVDGFVLPRGTALRGRMGKGDQTPCEYRTAQDVTLWPIELDRADYLPTRAAVSALGVSGLAGVKAGLRLRLKTAGDIPVSRLGLDRLVFHLRGSEGLPARLLEQLLARTVAVVVQPAATKAGWSQVLPRARVAPVGFADDEALLPHGPRSFQGYRYLQEYFAFPERFLQVEVTGLGPGIRRCEEREVDVLLLFDAPDPALESGVDSSHFALFCTPAINLFEKRADRIHLNDSRPEYHLVPDRSRPQDYEVFAVTSVTGFGANNQDKREFRPFYAVRDSDGPDDGGAFYTLSREPRMLSSRQRSHGPRSSYVGSEVFISLVDSQEAPFGADLRQLSITTVCTNRDLPLHMPLGGGRTDFSLETGAPVAAIRCVAGPTRPQPSRAYREVAWQLISHLSLNYLSLVDGVDGPGALRQLLGLYGGTNDAAIRRQIDGLAAVGSRPIVRRLEGAGPSAVARGLEVAVTLDEAAFEGAGVFPLGLVLENFFARYVSINSFTETVLKSTDRGEVMRWPPRLGQRQVM